MYIVELLCATATLISTLDKKLPCSNVDDNEILVPIFVSLLLNNNFLPYNIVIFTLQLNTFAP